MRSIVSGQHAVTDEEFAELALGIDTELFTGPAGEESEMERAARLAAARDILDDLRRDDPDLADYAAKLLHGDQFIVQWPPRQLALLLGGGIPRSGKAGFIAQFGREAA
jgi:hypothetical protein